jgi:hypothetical protein
MSTSVELAEMLLNESSKHPLKVPTAARNALVMIIMFTYPT